MESNCTWHFIDDEWALCVASGNLHRCTVTECQFRDDAGPAGVGKEHGGYSVCTLTARARETVEYVVAGMTPFKRHRHTAQERELYKDEAQSIIRRALFGQQQQQKEHKIPEGIVHICCRLWGVLQPKKPQCTLEALCIYVLVEMAQEGVRLRVGERFIQVLPKSSFLYAHLPSLNELVDREMQWTINISKLLSASQRCEQCATGSQHPLYFFVASDSKQQSWKASVSLNPAGWVAEQNEMHRKRAKKPLSPDYKRYELMLAIGPFVNHARQVRGIVDKEDTSLAAMINAVTALGEGQWYLSDKAKLQSLVSLKK